MSGPDTKEFRKPFDVKEVLGPQQQDLYFDLLNVVRRELIRQGGPQKNLTDKEKEAIAERVKGMSLGEFERSRAEVKENKPRETKKVATETELSVPDTKPAP